MPALPPDEEDSSVNLSEDLFEFEEDDIVMNENVEVTEGVARHGIYITVPGKKGTVENSIVSPSSYSASYLDATYGGTTARDESADRKVHYVDIQEGKKYMEENHVHMNVHDDSMVSYNDETVNNEDLSILLDGNDIQHVVNRPETVLNETVHEEIEDRIQTEEPIMQGANVDIEDSSRSNEDEDLPYTSMNNNMFIPHLKFPGQDTSSHIADYSSPEQTSSQPNSTNFRARVPEDLSCMAGSGTPTPILSYRDHDNPAYNNTTTFVRSNNNSPLVHHRGMSKQTLLSVQKAAVSREIRAQSCNSNRNLQSIHPALRVSLPAQLLDHKILSSSEFKANIQERHPEQRILRRVKTRPHQNLMQDVKKQAVNRDVRRVGRMKGSKELLAPSADVVTILSTYHEEEDEEAVNKEEKHSVDNSDEENSSNNDQDTQAQYFQSFITVPSRAQLQAKTAVAPPSVYADTDYPPFTSTYKIGDKTLTAEDMQTLSQVPYATTKHSDRTQVTGVINVDLYNYE